MSRVSGHFGAQKGSRTLPWGLVQMDLRRLAGGDIGSGDEPLAYARPDVELRLHPVTETLYVKVIIPEFEIKGKIVRSEESHITLGTYDVRPQSAHRKIESQEKVDALIARQIGLAKGRCDGQLFAMLVRYNDALPQSDYFPTETLTILHHGDRVRRMHAARTILELPALLVGIESLFSGNFPCVQKKRQMCGYGKFCFHMSLYGEIEISKAPGYPLDGERPAASSSSRPAEPSEPTADRKMFRIWVARSDEQRIAIEVTESDTIHFVKGIILYETGTWTDLQCLTVCGMRLYDGNTLGDYNICAEETIHLGEEPPDGARSGLPKDCRCSPSYDEWQ